MKYYATFSLLILLIFSIRSQGDLEVSGNAKISGQIQLGTIAQRNLIIGIPLPASIEASATDNTFIGSGAGVLIEGGKYNSIFGANAGLVITDEEYNSFFGYRSGELNKGEYNSFFGYQSGSASSTSSSNSFFGSQSGQMNDGNGNSFFGAAAGVFNSSGNYNSFFGSGSGSLNEEGEMNSFYGFQSGQSNKTADNNSFYGYQSGSFNISGSENSFFGSQAGSSSTGSNNSFFGFHSGMVNTGSENAFFGHNAGMSNSSGINNSFFGQGAGALVSTARNNSFFGQGAGNDIITGWNNTMIGVASEGSSSAATNQIVIGYLATGQGNNTATIGNSDITTVYMGEDGMATVMSSSDRRMKKEIRNSELGLDFIMRLRPVSYNWKNRKDFPIEFIKSESKAELEGGQNSQLQHGLIAQEVKHVIDKMGVEWQGWHENPENGRQGLDYEALVVPLIKAVQEQNVLIQELQVQMNILLKETKSKNIEVVELESTKD